MSGYQWESLERIVNDAVSANEIPGAVAAVGVGQVTLWRTATGLADTTIGQERMMDTDTLFDLASLTKVTATLPCILRLLEDGDFHLGTAVATFLPEFTGQMKDQVTIGQLLSHTAGLVSHRPYFQDHNSYPSVLEAVLQEPLATEPGTKVVYSDLGYIILGEVIRRVTRLSLGEFAQQAVYQPLGMTSTTYLPPAHLRPMIAATEIAADGVAKVGTVHDENAEAMGGISGHAGLFSNIHDMEIYVKSWLKEGKGALSNATRVASYRLRTSEAGGHRGLGWVLRGDVYDAAGDLWPDSTVGHTGFTGTSLSFDPVSEMWAILLTNHVHYGRTNRIVHLRRRFHNVVAAVVDEV